jgi:hypothetical protein
MKLCRWFGVLSFWVSVGGCQPARNATRSAQTTANADGTATLSEPLTPPPLVASASAGGAALDSPSPPALGDEAADGAQLKPSFDILADTDPHNDGLVAPPGELAGCLEELARNEVQFQPGDIPLSQKLRDVFTCGATQVVVYKGRHGSPRYNSSPRLTCRLALGLLRFEAVAEELAQKYFQASVRRVEQGGTYSCRKMARFANLVSEHSYANAIDIRSLQLTNGRTLSVKQHFGDIASAPTNQESAFLRELASRLYDDGVFSVVLTPFFDRLHHDHFHFDQARYRVDGTR